VPLNFPGDWRFTPPADGQFVNSAIPQSALGDFSSFIEKIRTELSTWWILEQFKHAFGASTRSSDEGWARTDLWRAMESEAENAPMFIENFFDACERLRSNPKVHYVPDTKRINDILEKNNLGYIIRVPELFARETAGPTIIVAPPPPSVSSRARELMEGSLSRSEELLNEGRPREAVQTVLWLLETVATAFRDLETGSGKIEGAYFNQIVRNLKAKQKSVTLTRILDWITNMHGFLSSPTGGGIRHGTDLNEGVEIDLNQARLFCNMTRSYLHFLIVEHGQLSEQRFDKGAT
jgi:hypothetical protein